MALKITVVQGVSQVWVRASHYLPGDVLVQQHTGELYLRVLNGIVAIGPTSNYAYENINYSGAPKTNFRKVQSELQVVL